MATAMNELMLETTIQLFRVIGDNTDRERIEGELKQRNLCTSSFVFREFLRTIINDLIFVHKRVQEMTEEADGKIALSKISIMMGKGSGNFSFRSAQRLHYITATILDGFDRTRVPRQRVLDYLERMTKTFVNDFLNSICLKMIELFLSGAAANWTEIATKSKTSDKGNLFHQCHLSLLAQPYSSINISQRYERQKAPWLILKANAMIGC
jgi:hypothetical protein